MNLCPHCDRPVVDVVRENERLRAGIEHLKRILETDREVAIKRFSNRGVALMTILDIYLEPVNIALSPLAVATHPDPPAMANFFDVGGEGGV